MAPPSYGILSYGTTFIWHPFIWHHRYIQGWGISGSSKEVREDVVETGLVDAPDYFLLLAHELQAARDIILGDSEGKSGLQLAYHL